MFCTLLLIVYNIEEAQRIRERCIKRHYWGNYEYKRDLQKLIDELWDCSIEMFGEHRYWDLISDACICIIAIRRSLK